MKANPKQLTKWLILATAVALDFFLWWPNKQDATLAIAYSLKADSVPFSMESVQPIPLDLKFDPAKVALGRELFHDVRLSADNSIACANCHVISAGGADNRTHAIGIHNTEGGINTPTVLNSGFNFVQFWNGRAATLEEQVGGPITNPGEMGSTWPQVITKLSLDANYKTAFRQIYAGKISEETIKNAIATFERSLVTPNSRFDRYLRGNSGALSQHEAHGFELFQNLGCISCHQGINLGGNMYERMGMMADYFGDRGNPTEADNGRFNVTHNEADRYYFRVPSLRNVALTAPYFHDGSAKSLSDAVRVMAKYQLGRAVAEDEVNDIVAFLYTLTGEIDQQGVTP